MHFVIEDVMESENRHTLTSRFFFYASVEMSRCCHSEKRGEVRQQGESVTAATTRLKSTVIGGATTNFMVDLTRKKRKDASEREKRECSRNPLRTFLLHISISRKKECPCKMTRVRFALFSIKDRSKNNFPLFLLDVDVYERCASAVRGNVRAK